MRISDKTLSLILRLLLLLVPMSVVTLESEGAKIAGISRAEADSIGRETVVYDGLPVTFNTLSRDLMKKVYGKENYRGLTAEQTVASMRLFPVEWKDEPIILVKDRDLRERLGATRKYLSLSSLFTSDGTYKVPALYDNADEKGQREIMELDEKVGILLQIISGDIIVKDDKVKLPEWRIDLELFYNRIPFLKIIFILLFSGAIISLVFHLGAGSRGRRIDLLLIRVFSGCSFVVALINFTLEWILAGRIPLSNMGETLSFTVLAGTGLTLFLSLWKGGKSGGNVVMYIAGMLFWGCVGLVSYLIGENPVITPLMPALQSPWLSIHVTLVMISYALLALTFVISIIGVCSPSGSDRLRKECMTMLYPGVGFLAAGIVMGSLWAKEAWGAYWSWDPKETCALVSLIAYSVPICVRLRGRWLYVYLLFAFLTVLTTYFGVNYFLGGRHSYV